LTLRLALLAAVELAEAEAEAPAPVAVGRRVVEAARVVEV